MSDTDLGEVIAKHFGGAVDPTANSDEGNTENNPQTLRDYLSFTRHLCGVLFYGSLVVCERVHAAVARYYRKRR